MYAPPPRRDRGVGFRATATVAAALFASALTTPLASGQPPGGGIPPVADDEADWRPGGAALLGVKGILQKHCRACHAGEGSSSGYAFDVLKRETMVGEGALAEGAPNPDEHSLYARMAAGEMPPEEIAERPTQQELALVRAWVAGGAPGFGGAAPRPFLTEDAVFEAVADDARRVAPQDRRYQRYVSFHTLHNDPNVDDTGLRLAAAGLSKLMNSLSWKPRIVPPAPVPVRPLADGAADGGAGPPASPAALFRLDLRDYFEPQHAAAQWHRIERAYPYGTIPQAQAPADRQVELCRDLGCSLPYVRGDWLVATASRPPLYHDLLRIGDSAVPLEEHLGVDIPGVLFGEANPRPEEFARAGMTLSGVSAQNRLVERLPTRYGSYWKSYDFKPASDLANLKRYPLGPRELRGHDNPFDRAAFEHDGGEVIFHLPNGLFAFMLLDGQDARIDAGPADVVSDSRKTGGTHEIINGLSCMACHAGGLQPVNDVVRGANTLAGDALRRVEALYPPRDVMNDLIAEDQERFRAATARTIAPLLFPEDTPRGAAAEEAVFGMPEPITFVNQLYRHRDLDWRAVARELGLEDPTRLYDYRGALRDVGLDGLLPEVRDPEAAGILSLRRPQFEAGPISLMQELAPLTDRSPVN